MPEFGRSARDIVDDWIAAWNERDADRLRLLLADDFVGVDNQIPGFGTFDAEVFASWATDEFPEVRTRHLAISSFESSGRAAMARAADIGETHDGDEIVWEVLACAVVGESQVRRVELFHIDAEAEARAVFRRVRSQRVNQATLHANARTAVMSAARAETRARNKTPERAICAPAVRVS